MATVSVAEVGRGVLRPLVGLGQQHAVVEPLVDVGADLFEEGEGLGEVLAGGALPLEEIGHCIETQAVDIHVQPEVDHFEHGAPHLGVVEVEIGLMGVEPMPVVRPGHRIPRPVRRLEILEDQPGLAVPVRRVAPHVEVAPGGSRASPPGPLEPGVLIRGVVEDQLGDDLEPLPAGLAHEGPEVAETSVAGVDPLVLSDVVPVVLERRGVERKEPDGGDAEVLKVVQLLDQAAEVADAVVVAVVEGLDVHLVDDGVLVPERVAGMRAQQVHAPRPRRHPAGFGPHAKYSKSCSVRERPRCRTRNTWAGTTDGFSSM